MKPSHYETLGVPKDAAADAIKRAYRKRTSRAHPDRAGGNAEEMAALAAAYAVIGDPVKRLHYDRTGQDKVPDLVKMARELILGKMAALINAEQFGGDPVAHTRLLIEADKSNHKNSLRQGKLLKQSVQKKLKRLKFKGRGTDFLTVAITYQLGQLDAQIADVQLKIEVCEAALPMLDDYDWEADIQSQHTPTGGGMQFFVAR